MCGIFGFVLNRPLNSGDVGLGRRGIEMLRYRGPDSEGEWVNADRGVYLGHRRLAIIDPTPASDQPMVHGRLVLTYNGELYNFEDIRRTLETLGYRFDTTGDTEVLLKAWAEWGTNALDRFDGMFAFAIYDGELLHLVTDPFGEKPLYWARAADGVYFASEAQVLIELLDLPFAPEDKDIAAFMALGFIPGWRTGFPGLEVVPPATHLRLSATGPLSRRRYWAPPPSQPHRGPLRPLSRRQLDRIQETLLVSLRRRMRADVPIGLFLSSGVDSSLVAAMVAKDLKLDLHAFTVSFPDGVDESVAAKGIAERLGLAHQVVDSREVEGWRDAPALLASLHGAPNDNMTAISVHQMSALARRHMKVALTGLGGDELFYGYSKYAFLYRWRHAYRLPTALMTASRMFDGLLGRNRTWRLASRLLRGNRAWRFVSIKNNGLGPFFDELPGHLEWENGEFRAERRELVYQVRDFDMGTTLPGSYIPAIDRGSMRASLEVRTPFLSRDLAETIAAMDQRAFLAFGQKEVLRQILYRYIPQERIPQVKQGFVFPAHRYLVTRSDVTPCVEGVPSHIAETIWKYRRDERYGGLAIRLSVLECFEERAAAASRAPGLGTKDGKVSRKLTRSW